jgi:dTDP-4-dehydrorhamnose reductase
LKILILDQESQVGHALAELLRSHPGLEWRGVPAALLFDSLDEVLALIRDYAPDFIVNSYSIGCAESAGGLDKSHVKMVKHLCRAARAAGAVFVHASSALVFNGARGKRFVETDRPKPKGSLSRRLTELEQTVIRQIDHHIILRTGWIFGGHSSGSFHRFLRGLETGAEIKLPSATEAAPTPTADMARVLFAIMQQLDCGAPSWGIYHYGSSDITNGRDFSETVITLAAQYGKINIENIRLVEGETQDHLGVPPHPILDCSKILNTFGIKQRPWRSAMTGILKHRYQEQHLEGQVLSI